MRYQQTQHTPKLFTTYEMSNGVRLTVMDITPIIGDLQHGGHMADALEFGVIQHGRPKGFTIGAYAWHDQPKRKLTRIQKGKLTKKSRFATKNDLDFNEWFIDAAARLALEHFKKNLITPAPVIHLLRPAIL